MFVAVFRKMKLKAFLKGKKVDFRSSESAQEIAG